MPRVRFGKVHVVNNVFNSTVAAQCVMAGFEADLLVESNVFENVTKPIDLMDNTFTAITSRRNIFTNTTGNTAGSGTAFTPPYSLTIDSAANVKSLVIQSAGATLTSPTCDTTSGAKQAVTTTETITGIYPNPTHGLSTISLSLQSNEEVVLKVFDVQGRLVNTMNPVRSATAGTQQVSLNLKNSKPGLYNIVVTSNKGKKQTYRLLLK